MSKEIATVKDFRSYFEEGKKNLSLALPKHLTPDRVVRIALSALMKNPVLLQCSKESVWLCVSSAANLGLEVDLLGSAYLVPFRNNKLNRMDCQLIVGYQGLIDLCRRSGHIESLEAHVVYANDQFVLEHGLNPVLKHIPTLEGEPGEFKFAYAVAQLKGGTKQYEVMTKRQIDEIRKRSKASSSGPWVTDYDEMARKTVVRRLVKYLPKSIEMQNAIVLEEDGFSPIEDVPAEVIETRMTEEKTGQTEKLKNDLKKKGPMSKRLGDEEPEPEPVPDMRVLLAQILTGYASEGITAGQLLAIWGKALTAENLSAEEIGELQDTLTDLQTGDLDRDDFLAQAKKQKQQQAELV